MKTRMEKYHKENIEVPKRQEKNTFLYEEIYDAKKEPTSNITLIDNVNEIDIDKIKKMIDSRENYKRSKDYKEIIGEVPIQKRTKDYDYKEPDYKDYDINELIKKKKDGTDEEEKIRKISQTQYDILRGLTISKENDFFAQEKTLTDISNDEDDDQKTIDFFSNLKAKEDEIETSEVISKSVGIKTLANTFEFEKGDFEDLNSSSKEEKSFTIKIVLIFIVTILVLAGVFYLVSQYLSSTS